MENINNELIRFANDSDNPVLRQMWQACFNQSPKETALFFDNLQKNENTLVLVIDSKPAAVLFTQKFSIMSPLRRYNGVYIYGVATMPEMQGKGCSTRLLKNANELFSHRKFACSALVPATKDLFDFYSKRGYESAFNINKADFDGGLVEEGETIPLKEISAEKLVWLRDARFTDSKLFACWDMEYIDYIKKESEFYGGGIYEIQYGNKPVAAVCYKDGDAVYVKELTATAVNLNIAIRSIKKHFDAKRLVLYLREDVQISYTNNILPFGMVTWYDNNIKNEMMRAKGAAPYITHALD